MAGTGNDGLGGGWVCQMFRLLSAAATRTSSKDVLAVVTLEGVGRELGGEVKGFEGVGRGGGGNWEGR